MKKLALVVAGMAAVFAAAEGSKFEVASVKKLPSSDGPAGAKSADRRGGSGPPLQIAQARFVYTGTLYTFIRGAYGIPGCGGSDCGLISGGPNWIDRDRFQIEARIPDGTPRTTAGLFGAGEAPELQLMLQALLAERFSLKVHHEEKQANAYVLSVDKNGPEPALKKTAGGLRSLFFRDKGPNDPMVHLDVTNWSMAALVRSLAPMLDRPVLDRTGLDGAFDFNAVYEKDRDAAPGNPQLVGSDMFRALREDLGLRLEAMKAAVDVIVIDHADQPSEN